MSLFKLVIRLIGIYAPADVRVISPSLSEKTSLVQKITPMVRAYT